MIKNNRMKNKGILAKAPSLLTSYLALKIYTRYRNIPAMYRNLQKLKPIYRNKPKYYLRLANLAYKQKMWKQSLEYIDAAILLTNDPPVIELYLYKANNFIHLGESGKAISCLHSYLSTRPDDAQAWRQLAREFIKTRQWVEAIDSFTSHLSLHPTDFTSRLQLAECYRRLKDYQNAEMHYKQVTEDFDLTANPEMFVTAYYWLGCMQLQNNSDQAPTTFKKVIQFDQQLNSQRFGIGVIHEHYKQWEYAAQAYQSQLLKDAKDAELYFKLASILDKKLYSPELALMHYEKALELDKVKSPWHFAFAHCYEQIKDYKRAAKWYNSAIARQEKHRPGNYRRLGFVLGQLGKTADALAAFKEAELFSKPTTINHGFYKKNITKPKVRYAISYEHYPVNERIIFYESLSGTRMMDSPFAIFEHIINKRDFKEFTHVWVVNSFHVIPNKYRSMDNIIFVKKRSDAYLKYICSAKYLICNSTFDPYVVRKPDQLYLQTSHGIFYKTVGRDSTGSPAGVAGSTRNLLQATHIIVPNEYMAEKQPKSYSIRGIHSGDIAKIGYPRIDVTVNITENDKLQIATSLGLETSKKIVLYVPTWRGESKSSNRFDSTQLIHDLNLLADLDVSVVFRGHPISNSLLKNIEFPTNVVIPPPDILTNELLGIADIVISDYSSVFFDFLVTERPIIHYLYDVDVYQKERGLNLREDELPGTIVKTSEQLINAVDSNLQNNKPSSHYLAVKERFCPYDDGKSTERIVKWFFYNDAQTIPVIEPTDSAQFLYLIGSLCDKERFSNLIHDLQHVTQSDDVFSILFSSDVSKDKEKRNLISKVNNSNINFIIHDKNMPTTLEEAFAIHYFQSNGEFINNNMETLYNNAYLREARRLFGEPQFDLVFNYEANSTYYEGLQANI